MAPGPGRAHGGGPGLHQPVPKVGGPLEKHRLGGPPVGWLRDGGAGPKKNQIFPDVRVKWTVESQSNRKNFLGVKIRETT